MSVKKFFFFVVCFLPIYSFADDSFDKKHKTELEYINKIKPIALKINLEVLEERALIEAIDIKNITSEQKNVLDKMAEKYDVFTPAKGNERYGYLKTKLLGKVDILSPSLLIAISGIETNWGQSRIVKEANSLYKELVWDGSGLTPIGAEKGAEYSIKKFDSLESSMRSFLLKINSSVDFEHFRHARSIYRIKKAPLQGIDIMQNFHLKTPLKNYTGLLDYTITFYGLDNIDRDNNYFK